MRRIIMLVSLLVLAAACTTPPPANTTANANKGEMKSTAAPSEADIIAKEKATWDAVKKKDWTNFDKMLTSDFIEVVDAGIHDKAATINNLKDFDVSDATFSDWKMTKIDNDAVILTYQVTLKANFKGQPAPAGPYRSSAAWVNRNGEWLAIYYQETLAKNVPPPPAASPTQSPKAAASPMASPGEAGPDAAANEKLVWDALKAKNWDAFASYLASDSIEVEQDGVYDKSGSVKGVSMYDFSKVQLADFKTVKLDDDASIVAYVVTDPAMKPEKSYHATIWAKRAGKWQAIFHQGTPAGTPPAASPSATKM